MNAKARTARATLRNRTRIQRATSRITRRGAGSLATYGIAVGLGPKAARSMADGLRNNARKAGITGIEARVHAGRRMRTTHRYTPAEVITAKATYEPIKPEYIQAAARLDMTFAA